MKTNIILILAILFGMPLYAQRGYWYHDTFIALQKADTSAFYVQMRNPQGEALKANEARTLLNVGEGVVCEVSGKGIIIKSDKRPTNKEVYVSEIYVKDTRRVNRDVLVLPRISMRLYEDVDIQSIIREYNSLISFESLQFGVYILRCNVSSSDEVLELASR